jgi:hypothetical protein
VSRAEGRRWWWLGRPSRSRLRYRSPVRVLIWTPFGVVFIVAGIGSTTEGNAPAVVFAGLGLVVLGFAWWPRLVISRDGVEVRNLAVTRLAWHDVGGVGVRSQLPYMGRVMQRIHSFAQRSRGPGVGTQGYPGLVINTHSLGPVAVVAAQRSVLSGRAGYADRVGEELVVARHAAARHVDPVRAVLDARGVRTSAGDSSGD